MQGPGQQSLGLSTEGENPPFLSSNPPSTYTPKHDATSGQADEARPMTPEEREQREIKRQRKALREKIQQRQQTIAQVLQRTPDQGHNEAGLMGEFSHMNAYNQEGLPGKVAAELFILLFELLFNLNYVRNVTEFNQLIKGEAAMDQGPDRNEKIRLTYRQDESGEYPELYPLGGDGKPDGSKEAYTQEQLDWMDADAKEYLIRKNGYVPMPSFQAGLEMAFTGYVKEVLGPKALSHLQRERHGLGISRQQAQDDGVDPRLIAAAAAPAARPPGR